MFSNKDLETLSQRAREMAWCSTALVDDPSSLSRTHVRWLSAILSPAPGDETAPCASMAICPHTHTAPLHRYTQIHRFKVKGKA